MSTSDSYSIVLKDLEDRQRRCLEEIQRWSLEQKTIAQTITSLRQISLTQEVLPFAIPQRNEVSSTVPQHSSLVPGLAVYSGLSTRWAILYLLAEHATGPLGRSEIAKALVDGGITSTAQSFASNVSAVLSGMVNDRKEVEQVENAGYRITGHGREVWEGVKRTPQWASRTSISVAS